MSGSVGVRCCWSSIPRSRDPTGVHPPAKIPTSSPGLTSAAVLESVASRSGRPASKPSVAGEGGDLPSSIGRPVHPGGEVAHVELAASGRTHPSWDPLALARLRMPQSCREHQDNVRGKLSGGLHAICVPSPRSVAGWDRGCQGSILEDRIPFSIARFAPRAEGAAWNRPIRVDAQTPPLSIPWTEVQRHAEVNRHRRPLAPIGIGAKRRTASASIHETSGQGGQR